MPEIQPRYSRDTAEIQPRCSRDTAEVQPYSPSHLEPAEPHQLDDVPLLVSPDRPALVELLEERAVRGRGVEHLRGRLPGEGSGKVPCEVSSGGRSRARSRRPHARATREPQRARRRPSLPSPCGTRTRAGSRRAGRAAPVHRDGCEERRSSQSQTSTGRERRTASKRAAPSQRRTAARVWSSGSEKGSHSSRGTKPLTCAGGEGGGGR